jgi:Fe-Mn family superoxide dismutase
MISAELLLSFGLKSRKNTMSYELPPLPYDYSALDPYISKSTLEFHHDKHHAAYVKKFNDAVQGTELDSMSIEEVIKTVAGDAEKTGIFNNAAQAWNHTFYWNCMKPSGGGTPNGALADKIKADFGSFEQFVEAFKTAGATQFGSGWAWLVLENGTLKVTKTLNADNPITSGQVPLLTMDVWEHAYYLDYQNARPQYIETFLNNLVNWEFVADNLAAAT